MDLVSPVVQRWIQDARENPEAFWGRAAEQLPWLRTWDRVFEWTPPTFRWYTGGQTNLAYNALDHHVKRGWGGHTALVYLSERGERRLFTYAQLLHEVERLAAALRGMGIQIVDSIPKLLEKVDDRYVIMNAGDEIRLRFDAPPAPAEGWKRTFVWVSDGWVKDGDLNTRFGKTVLPLPYHGMKSYDTPPGRLADDPVYRRFPLDWEVYHTRYVTPELFERGLRSFRRP